MLEFPRRPEGTLQEKIEQLYKMIWSLTEAVNLLEEELRKQENGLPRQ